MYLKPDGQSSLAILTSSSDMQIFKVSHSNKEKIETQKILSTIKINNSFPQYAWNNVVYRSSLGLMFFQIEAQNGQRGPFKIQLLLLQYETEKTSTILEFTHQSDGMAKVMSIQLFEKRARPLIECETIEGLRNLLNHYFLCISFDDPVAEAG